MSTRATMIDPERQMLGEVEMVGQDRWEEIHRRAGAGASMMTSISVLLPLAFGPTRIWKLPSRRTSTWRRHRQFSAWMRRIMK